MKAIHRLLLIPVIAGALISIPAFAQQNPPAKPAGQSQDHSDMPGMDMSGMQHDSPGASQVVDTANEEMSEMHMGMGPHMHMTDLRPANAADEKRAEQIVETLRPAIEKYKDYQVALDEGFKIFHPELPQEHYHFTNYSYALEAQFTFNPTHPTSLLYKKVDGRYVLEGAMYTAPRRYTDEQLNERVPLSVARWHEHVNLCMPPKGEGITMVNWHEFGLRGSIATEDACDTAGGHWIPIIFNWMVHVYPYETDPAKVWAH
jgi:hypothetical protein